MKRLGRTRGALAFALTTLLVGYLLSRPPGEPAAVAAPHTISAVPHPFDPDWPDVYLLMANKCAGCHRAGSERCDLTDYDCLTDGVTKYGDRLIVPGKPEESLLYQMVEWNVDAQIDSDLPDAPQMPDEQAQWLTRGQLDTLARWIRNGALEYRLPDGCSPRPLIEMDFPSARECKACHPKQFDEWSRSMHHYAQHSPIFEAFNLTLIERTSGTMGTFCTRCHTPLGTAIGENGSRRNVNRSRLSMEGVTCVVCHRQSRPFYKANARQVIEPGKILDGCMYGPFTDPIDNNLTKSHPAAGVPHIKTSAFCGACHDVTSPEGVRLEEAYSEWQNSPAARQGITCQMCHMGPVQGKPIPESHRPLGRAAEVPGVDPALIPLRHLSDHTFAGPDYSILPDTEFPHKLDWMYETDYRDYDRLTPHQQKTLGDLRRSNRRHLEIYDQKRLELLRNAAEISVEAPRYAAGGERIKLRVDVHSKFGGHSFPTGFTAERQLWVEIVLRDPAGRVVFQSGDLDSNNDLRDGHSHDVESGKVATDRYLLNFQNKFVALTQRGTDRTVVLSVNRHLAPLNILRPATTLSASYGRPPVFRIAKGSLPALQTMGQAYPIELPSMPGDYHWQARLNFRHIPPVLMDHIGIPHLKHQLQIVVIDQKEGILRVVGR